MDILGLLDVCLREMTQAVCKCIPPAQATGFLTAILDSLLHITPTCARAVWEWLFVFLVECRTEILQQVPKILNTLYIYMQQSTHRPFSLHAVFLLTNFHWEPMISSLLQKGLSWTDQLCHLRGGACPEEHGGAQATASPPPFQPSEVGQ
ncbi:maestro heat-like repeat-containing protein family member 2B [Phalacrocorax carbo]|uniref:maestro heat-like repeat-containing protein family member 2B n=1 Tax=Phalacrocorax carbo TaxID=9209 RepID=UPI00311A2DE3